MGHDLLMGCDNLKEGFCAALLVPAYYGLGLICAKYVYEVASGTCCMELVWDWLGSFLEAGWVYLEMEN